ncbi:unnamed protein product [Cuscuta campestris]|uniref:Uncharacterized protein n=1 Tax=Cuscuta campestris TaxID=132261 RepID=A0A484MMT0_9ASTE|nr:unnamed protein product [Cuscuta campestris]
MTVVLDRFDGSNFDPIGSIGSNWVCSCAIGSNWVGIGLLHDSFGQTVCLGRLAGMPGPAVRAGWWGCPGRLTELFGPAVRGYPIGAAGQVAGSVRWVVALIRCKLILFRRVQQT